MNRTTKIAFLAGAGVLAAAIAGYFIAAQREPAAPGQAAVLLSAPVPTKSFWAARVSPLAGSGQDGVLDGAAPQSRFSDPFGLAVDPQGLVYVADGGDGNRIRRIDRNGLVSTFAGGREGFTDGVGALAAFHTPSAIAFDRFGNLYVADTGNHAIR